MAKYLHWRKVITKQLSIAQVIKQLKLANLQNLAGKSFSEQLLQVTTSKFAQRYIICDAQEVEPGTFKDRDIILQQTTELLEGMMIAGITSGAEVGYIYLRKDFVQQQDKLQAQLDYLYSNHLLGENILNSGYNFNLQILISAGGYILGEPTALLNALAGYKGFPKLTPPWPWQAGLYGFPTLVANVEVLANISQILQRNQEEQLVGSDNAKIRRLFSVSGHVKQPGNYRLPLGATFKELLALAGGIVGNKRLKAVLPGGISAPIVPAKIMLELTLDHQALANAGSTLGSGAIIIMDESTCMATVFQEVLRFYHAESCGQCTPCREGTSWMYKLASKICAGRATVQDWELIAKIATDLIGKSICQFGDMAARSVKSFVQHFATEINSSIVYGEHHVNLDD